MNSTMRTPEELELAKYFRARRSIKIWPVIREEGEELEMAVRRFFAIKMGVPPAMARDVNIDTLRHISQPKKSRVQNEILVTFAEQEERDNIHSYANGLAKSGGAAGLRIDVPPMLKQSFRLLDEHGMTMVNIYGKGVKRSIKFDDRNRDLMMDIKLPTSDVWHNITVEQAKEARKVRVESDLRSLRAIGAKTIQPSIGEERAKALMLNYSPSSSKGDANGAYEEQDEVRFVRTPSSNAPWGGAPSQSGDNESSSMDEEGIREILRDNRSRSNTYGRSQ